MTEVPLAKSMSRPVPQSLEGKVIVIQAADLMATRKIIPDLAVWSQCFSLYVAVLAAHQPRRVTEMTAYQTIISKASQKYRWLSWFIYDQNFCQDAAGHPSQSWAKVVPRPYTQCYTGQAVSAENWCLLHCLHFFCAMYSIQISATISRVLSTFLLMLYHTITVTIFLLPLLRYLLTLPWCHSSSGA